MGAQHSRGLGGRKTPRWSPPAGWRRTVCPWVCAGVGGTFQAPVRAASRMDAGFGMGATARSRSAAWKLCAARTGRAKTKSRWVLLP